MDKVETALRYIFPEQYWGAKFAKAYLMPSSASELSQVVGAVAQLGNKNPWPLLGYTTSKLTKRVTNGTPLVVPAKSVPKSSDYGLKKTGPVKVRPKVSVANDDRLVDQFLERSMRRETRRTSRKRSPNPRSGLNALLW
jgi:hypothetical protein